MGKIIQQRISGNLKPQINELQQTLKAFSSWVLGPALLEPLKLEDHCQRTPGKEVWDYLDKKTLKLSYRHNVLRNGLMSFIVLLVLYLVFNLQGGVTKSQAIEMVGVTMLATAAIWLVWRVTLKSGRNIAKIINASFEEPLIAEPDHPNVIFGAWIKRPRSRLKPLLMKPIAWLLPKN